MRRLIRFLMIAIPGTIACLLVAGVLILKSDAFRDFFRSQIVKQVAAKTGASLEIGAVTPHWTHLSLDASAIKVFGSQSSSPGEASLLEVQRLEVGVRFLPLLRGRVELSNLVLDHPIARLKIDAQGRSNLPTSSAKNTSGNGVEQLFDLKIGRCAIVSGDIYYNDLQIPLDADFHNLAFSAGYSLLTGRYQGSLQYDQGHLLSRGIAPVSHAVNLQFTADSKGLEFSPLVLSSGESYLTSNVQLTDYANPNIQASYVGDVETEEVAKTFGLGSIPIGSVQLAGTLSYQTEAQETFLAALNLKGHATSKRLQYRESRRPIDLTLVSADYVLSSGDLQVKNVTARALGGSLGGNWETKGLSGRNPKSVLEARIKGISLARANDALAPSNIRRIPIAGISDLSLHATWAGKPSNAIADARLTLASQQKSRTPDGIPIDGIVQMHYNGPENSVSFGQSHLQTLSTRLALSGTLTRKHQGARLSVTLATSRLQEVEYLVEVVDQALRSDKGAASKGISFPAISGSANLAANISGVLNNPQIDARVNAQNVAFNSNSWRSISFAANASSSRVNIQTGSITGQSREQINFSGQASLTNWKLNSSSAINAQATVFGLPVTQVQSLANLHYPVTGVLSGRIAVRGTQNNPQGSATLTLVNAKAWDEPVNNATLTAQAEGGSLHATLGLRLPAAGISSEVNYRIEKREFSIHVESNAVDLGKIAALQKKGAIEGVARLTATGNGTIQNPQLNASFTVPQLKIQGQTFSNLSAVVDTGNQHAILKIHAITDKGSIQSQGDVSLTGDHYTTATLDVRDLPVGAVLAELLPSEVNSFSGQADLHLDVRGPLSKPADLEGHLQIPTLNVKYQNEQIGLAHPLQADYRSGTLTILPSQIQGMGTNLTFGGSVPLSQGGSYSLNAQGNTDLSIFQKFLPGVRSSGQATIDLHGQGSFSRPDFHGQVQVKNAVFASQDLPVAIEGLNAALNVNGERADITNLSGTAGGGKISAQGFVYLGHNANFNLALNASSVRVRYPEGLRSVLSGQLNLTGTPADSYLTGRVSVDNLSFTQQFDLANFAAGFGEASTGSPSSLERNMKLRISVQSSPNVNLASSQISVGGSASLNLVGNLANPIVLGRINLTSGEVFFLGKRFEVQSGSIDFANPARTAPMVRVYVATTVEQYNLVLNLTGPAENLRINYTSDPPLPAVDIIHLLAFGNTNAEAASQPSQSVGASAESVLASGVSGRLAGGLQNLTGISQLTLDPLATNNQGDPAAQIGIQERVTGNLLLTFSTSVTTTQGQTIEVQYDLNKRWSVTALRDQNGGFGLNIRLHKTF